MNMDKMIESLWKQLEGKIYALHDSYGHYLSEEDAEIVEVIRCLMNLRNKNKVK